jgi:hypothetical protein
MASIEHIQSDDETVRKQRVVEIRTAHILVVADISEAGSYNGAGKMTPS